ncbi:MAG: TolC family protein, partial [Phycisphaerales bacterium]|nr:TolC family protein [Phycisphaerales bacterium]
MLLPHWRTCRSPVPLLAGLVLCCAGCTADLSDIDRRTDRLLKERSASLLGATIHPELASRGLDQPINQLRVADTDPRTNDPAASQLALKPADEARDVASRLASYGENAQSGLALDLTAALRQAQRTSREYLAAQDAYLLAAINLLIERHLWDPRFFGTTTAQVTPAGANGDYSAPLQIINELRATQRLPSGGTVEAAYVWNATQQLVDAATDRYVQASSLVVNANIPLLRGAGRSARESLIQQERNLVYAARSFETARRTLLVQLSRDYFDLLQQQRTMENQQRALDLLKNLERRTAALVQAGRLAEFQKNIAANDVLRATSQLASQRERFILSVDRFKLRIGLDVSTPVTIKGEVPVLPEPDVTPDFAALAALDYRLDLQTARDRRDDARRGVLIARNNTLADVNLFGGATLRSDPRRSAGGLGLGLDDNAYQAGVRVDWALDRQNERLAVRAAQVAAERAQRDID